MSAVKSIRVGVFFFKKKTSFHLPSKKFSKIGPFTASFFIPVFLKVVSKKKVFCNKTPHFATKQKQLADTNIFHHTTKTRIFYLKN